MRDGVQFERHLQGVGCRWADQARTRCPLYARGSGRKAGERVRITVRLIKATTGAHLWAERFDGSFGAVFDLQDKAAFRVAGAIEPVLQAAETRSHLIIFLDGSSRHREAIISLADASLKHSPYCCSRAKRCRSIRLSDSWRADAPDPTG